MRTLYLLIGLLLVVNLATAGRGGDDDDDDDDDDEDDDICSGIKKERCNEDEEEGRKWGDDEEDNETGEGDKEKPGRDINENLMDLLDTDEPEACGGKRSCVKGESDCEPSGFCKCKAEYAYGNPNLACFKENVIGGQIKNDPLLTTFSQETTHFPFPCRYMITHVKQKLKDKQDNKIGTCEFEVYGYNAKKKGKIYVLGFDVAAKIKYDSGETIKLSSRNYGIMKNKMPSIYSSGTMGEYLPEGPWGRDKVEYKDSPNGIKIGLKSKKDSKQVQFLAEGCGFKITWVPYDVKKMRNQRMVPGIAIKIDENYNKKFLSEEKAMLLAPYYGDLGYFEGHLRPGLNAEQSMLVRAFTTDVTHNQPAGNQEQCEKVGSALNKCSEAQLEEAIKSCYWMLEEPRFIRCFDKKPSSKKLMKLFRKCVDIYCNDRECSEVQDIIADKGCAEVPYIRRLSRFMNGEACPAEIV